MNVRNVWEVAKYAFAAGMGLFGAGAIVVGGTKLVQSGVGELAVRKIMGKKQEEKNASETDAADQI